MGAWDKVGFGDAVVPADAKCSRLPGANGHPQRQIVLMRPARNLLPAETPLFRRLTAEELAIEGAATGEETPDTPAYMRRPRPPGTKPRTNLLISQHWRSRAGCSTRVSVLPE